jgi:hypothetical protein
VFAQVVKAKIEEARALAVNDGNAKRGLGSQQCRQRFQLKAGLEINLGGSEIRRQFVLLPEILSGAGKHCLPPGMAAKVRGEVEDAIKVSVKRSILAGSGSALQGLLHDIFGHDCLAAMGTILGRIGLKVKTEGARPFGFVRVKSR